MPLQRYDKEQILEDCFELFVQKGYSHTTTAMLSEAAGVSKALLFHHFGSKKKLYISILSRCFEQLATELKEEPVSSFKDFFEAKEKSGIPRIAYLRDHPKMSKFLHEAYSNTPHDVKEEVHHFTVQIKEKYAFKENLRGKQMKELFDRVSLREGLLKRDALELIGVIDEYFRTTIATQLTDERKLRDDEYWTTILQKKKLFLDMIRFGIEHQGE